MTKTTQEEIKWEKVGGQGNLDAKMWDFNKDGDLIGEVKSKLENVGPNASRLYEIENTDGIFSVWGCSALDRNMMAINVGNIIKISFIGLQKNPNTGRTFKNFEVYRKA